LSSWSSYSIEEVNSAGPGTRFFQLSVYKDRNLLQQVIGRAEKASYKVLTVDDPWLGRRKLMSRTGPDPSNMSSVYT